MKKTFDPNAPLHPHPLKLLTLRDLMPSANIKVKMEARDKNQVLAEMAGYAFFLGAVHEKDPLLIALVERERMLSTGMPGGVAFLHPRRRHPKLIKHNSLVLGLSQEGIDFDAPDGKPTNLFFLLLLKTDEQHLRTLSDLARLFQNPQFAQQMLQAVSSQAIFDLLPRS